MAQTRVDLPVPLGFGGVIDGLLAARMHGGDATLGPRMRLSRDPGVMVTWPLYVCKCAWGDVASCAAISCIHAHAMSP